MSSWTMEVPRAESTLISMMSPFPQGDNHFLVPPVDLAAGGFQRPRGGTFYYALKAIEKKILQPHALYTLGTMISIGFPRTYCIVKAAFPRLMPDDPLEMIASSPQKPVTRRGLRSDCQAMMDT